MLKTVTLDVIKKNRVYFKCKNMQGYDVKLRVTPTSENLELGKQDLLVRDETVRTKYGTDVIYSLEAEIKEDGIITLKHRYNTKLIEACQQLGGRWDDSEKVWVFPKIVEDKVEDLDAKYNSDMKEIEIMALCDRNVGADSVKFWGYPIARAFGRDSGAKICEDVCMTEGRVSSSGSMKNWCTFVEQGSKFRLKVSQNIIDEYRMLDDDVKKWGLVIL